MAIREGLWDCPECGQKGVRGGSRTCTNCGKERTEGVTFYLPGNAPAVTDAKQLEQARAGADWYCAYCKSGNSNAHNVCQFCGAKREAAKDDGFWKKPLSSAFAPRPSLGAITDKSDFDAPMFSLRKPRLKSRTMLWVGIAAAASLLLGLGLYLLLRTKDVNLTVTAFDWERTIAVEAYRTVIEEDWDVPPGGREKDSWRAIHHYDRVIDHYETRTERVCRQVQSGSERYVCGQRNLGNGYFEDRYCERPIYKEECHNETRSEPVYRDEPVYRTKYRYEIERWKHDRTEQARGNDQKPAWPTVTLKTEPLERENGRSEQYIAHFKDKNNKSYLLKLPLSEWQNLSTDETVIGKVNSLGLQKIVKLEKQ